MAPWSQNDKNNDLECFQEREIKMQILFSENSICIPRLVQVLTGEKARGGGA